MDAFGNITVVGGTSERHGELEFRSEGVVEQSVYCIPDAAPHPMYALPSALADSVKAQLLQDIRRLEGESAAMPFLERSLAIAHYVHELVEYVPDTTDVHTAASQVAVLRKGVCQDFAHLMISLCREMGMKSRYVCGLMMGEGQTHAWVEVHDGQCWYAFDPTNDTAIATGYIKIAHGRDALDCPVSRGTYVGVAQQETEVSVCVTGRKLAGN